MPQQLSRVLFSGGEGDELLVVRFPGRPLIPLEKLLEDPGYPDPREICTRSQFSEGRNWKIDLAMLLKVGKVFQAVHLYLLEDKGDQRGYKTAGYRFRLARIICFDQWPQLRYQLLVWLSRTRC